jgi:DNA-binding NarL/FixJ family response regulator
MSRPPNPAPTRILIADDHSVVRAGLRAVLRHQRDMTVVGEASTADELVRVAREVQPDVAIVDLKMPGDTLQAINELTSATARLSVVIFTAFDQATDAALCFQAGASGYVTKTAPEEELLGAIRRVRTGGYHRASGRLCSSESSSAGASRKRRRPFPFARPKSCS